MEPLIINGINFDKRLEDAKDFIYTMIDWRAQQAGLGPFFTVHSVPQKEDENIKLFKECIEYWRSVSSIDKDFMISMYTAKLAEYIAYMPQQIQFELRRISKLGC